MPVGSYSPPPVTVMLIVQSLGACVIVIGYGCGDPMALKTAVTLLAGFFTIFRTALSVSAGALPPLGVAAANNGLHALVPSEAVHRASTLASAYSLSCSMIR